MGNIPESLPGEIFESLINTSGVRVERIISKGHTSPETGWYEQAQNEWVMVLQGQPSNLCCSHRHDNLLRSIQRRVRCCPVPATAVRAERAAISSLQVSWATHS